MLVDRLRHRRPDAGRAGQVLGAGAQHALQPAEMPQQRAPARGTQAGDGFQHRGLAGPGALATILLAFAGVPVDSPKFFGQIAVILLVLAITLALMLVTGPVMLRGRLTSLLSAFNGSGVQPGTLYPPSPPQRAQAREVRAALDRVRRELAVLLP